MDSPTHPMPSAIERRIRRFTDPVALARRHRVDWIWIPDSQTGEDQ